MPLQQGEVSLLTLFADVHTYLAPPTSRPVHHRFDRRSYLYLFHDALNKRGRIEIANNAGTPDQDAFAGYLDGAHVTYSYKQPTLFTITADSQGRSQPGSPQNDISQWHLPSFDPSNQNKYMYKIHTLDLYLWTVEDANLLIDSLRRVLQPSQLTLNDVPSSLHSEHRNSMSPVVQQLEKMAVTAPAPQRMGSTSTTQSFPPPPPSQPASGTPASPQQQAFTPVAYNPAAPGVPEQRMHREKTPPPPDADTGTGLNGAEQHNQGYPYGQPGAPQGGFGPQQGSFGPQTSGFGPSQGGFGPQQSSYTGHPGMQRTSTQNSMPPPPSSASPYQTSFAGPPQHAATPSQDPNAHLYAQQPGTPGLNRQSTHPYQTSQPAQSATSQTQYANYPSAVASAQGPPATPSYQPQSVQSPGFAPQGYGQPQQYPSQAATPTQHQSSTHVPQQGGYGQYNPASTTHAMHSQFYTPEGASQPAVAGPGSHGGQGKVDPSKLDATMQRVEGKVGKFLKRLDKKL